MLERGMKGNDLKVHALLWTGIKSAGPWCYVQKDTCKHQPIADNTGLFYDNCATINSTHTVDTCKASVTLPRGSIVITDLAVKSPAHVVFFLYSFLHATRCGVSSLFPACAPVDTMTCTIPSLAFGQLSFPFRLPAMPIGPTSLSDS